QEYQSKELLSKHGCTVQKFIVAASKQEAEEKMKFLGSVVRNDDTEYVVKAQILAGGRGKGHFINGRADIGGVFITLK
ncbi:ATP-grasp domain protein, partial [Dictyocaulus viviparus]